MLVKADPQLALNLPESGPKEPGRLYKWVVRVFVLVTLVGSIALTLTLDVPRPIPEYALRQELIFHLERVLLFFYGSSLVFALTKAGILIVLDAFRNPRGHHSQAV